MPRALRLLLGLLRRRLHRKGCAYKPIDFACYVPGPRGARGRHVACECGKVFFSDLMDHVKTR